MTDESGRSGATTPVRGETGRLIPETEADRRLVEDVTNHGWHVVRVPPRSTPPGWAFSVGLYRRFGHPEIIVFGLPPEALHSLVDRVAAAVADGGRYPADSTSDRILEGYTCGMRPVARRWYAAFLGYATWFYAGEEFPVVQCRWPDRENRLPEHPEFDCELAELQPLLDRESAEEARVEALLHSLDML
jgi:hypothetical protein